jgi:hypothetical protein
MPKPPLLDVCHALRNAVGGTQRGAKADGDVDAHRSAYKSAAIHAMSFGAPTGRRRLDFDPRKRKVTPRHYSAQLAN